MRVKLAEVLDGRQPDTLLLRSTRHLYMSSGDAVARSQSLNQKADRCTAPEDQPPWIECLRQGSEELWADVVHQLRLRFISKRRVVRLNRFRFTKTQNIARPPIHYCDHGDLTPTELTHPGRGCSSASLFAQVGSDDEASTIVSPAPEVSNQRQSYPWRRAGDNRATPLDCASYL